MSNNRLILNTAEFLAELRALPPALAAEGADVVVDTTERAATNLRAAYPLGDTGNLRKGVKSSIERSAFGTVGTVKSTARHAYLWEFGSAVRKTRQGWNRGQMPANRMEGLVPIAVRERKRMNGQLVEIVKRAGFEVNGTP